ncbi:MAG: ATP-binding protein [Bacillota bacterium]
MTAGKERTPLRIEDSPPLQKYENALRSQYWTGHFFFMVAVLSVVATQTAPATSWTVSLRPLMAGWAIMLALTVILQRSIDLSGWSPVRPWPLKGVLFAALSAAGLLAIIAVTGGHASPYKALVICSAVLSALHFGWRISFLTAFLVMIPHMFFDQGNIETNLTKAMGEDFFLLAVSCTVGWLVGSINEINRNLAQDLVKERSFLETVINVSPSGLFVLDRDGVVIYANKTIDAMLGRNIAGLNVIDLQDLGLLLEEDTGETREHIRKGIPVTGVPGQLIRGDEVRELEGDYIPLPSFNNVEAVLVIARDVTERRRAATLSTVGQMAAGLAHEIRNPLTGIRGFAQLIAERDTRDPIEKIIPYTETIIQECDRVNRLLTEFLAFAKPKDTVIKPLELNLVVIAAASMANTTAAMSDTTLEIELGGILMINGDRDKLIQLTLNLLHNAIDAAGCNGHVRISTGLESGQVFLRVADNGPGIPAEIREKIFQPFFTTRDEGTGLGLAISERIIREHGARIELHSSSKGTTFTVWFKAVDELPPSAGED